MNERGYKALCSFFENKTVSLVGAGVSNLPLVSFLYSCGASSVVVRDLKKKAEDPEIQKVLADGGKICLGENYLEELSEEIIIRSPGIRPDIPPFINATENGSFLTCETELFLRFVPCKTIAITGSDGKTTTTTLIAKILEEAGHKVILGGNIGKSMLPQLKQIDSDSHVSVMELSSFQLMNCKYSPDVAVITNLSENHLDWHVDMNEYLEAKKNLLLHQNQNSRAVLNLDNEHTANCVAIGDVCYFSCFAERKASAGKHYSERVYLDGDEIYHEKNGIREKILSTSNILLPGKHNVENYMAAIAAVQGLATKDAVLKIAESFGGVEHRIELCRELNGVRFYNSSIDSSPSRSTAALRAFREKVIMIAGGYDKNLDYTALGDEICRHVKVLILCGATAEKIRTAVLSSPLYDPDALKIIDSPSFDDTARLAKENAVFGDKVILSPASASFDLFKNFEERGKRFKTLVSEL